VYFSPTAHTTSSRPATISSVQALLTCPSRSGSAEAYLMV
jgi:hypothetical protein